MGLIKKVKGPFRFSLEDDKEKPSTILWRLATPLEMGKYEAARAEIASRTSQEVTTGEESADFIEELLSFSMGLIVGVENWNVEGPDGEPVPLTWENDAKAVLESLADLPRALVRLFGSHVYRAHYPDSARQFRAAVGLPNS